MVGKHLLPLVIAGCLVSCAKPSQGEGPIRLVLITLDTLRADSVRGSMGEEAEMPAVQTLAERGLLFDRAFSSTSSTQPTHASLFTGLHPWQHGVTRNGMVLGEEQHTLAEWLKESGFATSAIVASFPLHRTFGYDQGFDRFDDKFARRLQNRDEWRGQEVEGKAFYVLAKSVTDRAIAEIDRASTSKQFSGFTTSTLTRPMATLSARLRRASSATLRASKQTTQRVASSMTLTYALWTSR